MNPFSRVIPDNNSCSDQNAILILIGSWVSVYFEARLVLILSNSGGNKFVRTPSPEGPGLPVSLWSKRQIIDWQYHATRGEILQIWEVKTSTISYYSASESQNMKRLTLALQNKRTHTSIALQVCKQSPTPRTQHERRKVANDSTWTWISV